MSADRGPREPISPPTGLGRWQPDGPAPSADPSAVAAALADVRRPVVLVRAAAGPALAVDGSVALSGTDGLPVLAVLPPIHPSALGDPAFCAEHGLRFPYVTGAMANGIASAELV